MAVKYVNMAKGHSCAYITRFIYRQEKGAGCCQTQSYLNTKLRVEIRTVGPISFFRKGFPVSCTRCGNMANYLAMINYHLKIFFKYLIYILTIVLASKKK